MEAVKIEKVRELAVLVLLNCYVSTVSSTSMYCKEILNFKFNDKSKLTN